MGGGSTTVSISSTSSRKVQMPQQQCLSHTTMPKSISSNKPLSASPAAAPYKQSSGTLKHPVGGHASLGGSYGIHNYDRAAGVSHGSTVRSSSRDSGSSSSRTTSRTGSRGGVGGGKGSNTMLPSVGGMRRGRNPIKNRMGDGGQSVKVFQPDQSSSKSVPSKGEDKFVYVDNKTVI